MWLGIWENGCRVTFGLVKWVTIDYFVEISCHWIQGWYKLGNDCSFNYLLITRLSLYHVCTRIMNLNIGYEFCAYFYQVPVREIYTAICPEAWLK